jgi:hypothetical protein
LQHPQIKNLYPCAEGAGYAGGIVAPQWMAKEEQQIEITLNKKTNLLIFKRFCTKIFAATDYSNVFHQEI